MIMEYQDGNITYLKVWDDDHTFYRKIIVKDASIHFFDNPENIVSSEVVGINELPLKVVRVFMPYLNRYLNKNGVT